jgi:3',5'-cyclic AMP phosphodiesterase CpdA
MTRLLHLSDPHFGAADDRVAAAFLEQAAELAPDLTVLSGDLTMRARRGELAAAKAFTGRLPRPLFLIPGNHDIPAFNHPWDRLFRPFRRYRETFGRELEPEWRGGGLQVIGLNSNRALGLHADWSEGRLSRGQLARAEQRFGTAENDLRVLVLHHPLLAPDGHGRAVVKPLPALLGLLTRCRVDLVLCGHFHRSHLATAGADDSWRSVVSQAPTVCSTRLQGEPPGFHQLDWTGDRLHVTRHRGGPGGFAPDARFTFERAAGGWRISESAA